MGIYKDYFQTKRKFSGFEDLLLDPEFSKAFGDEREKNVQPIMNFLLNRMGDHADKSFLDIGAGYGSLSLPLAKRMSRGVAADVLEYSLAVLRHRARINSIKNLSVMRVDAFNDITLPFQTGSFDLVLLNGVIEYAGLCNNGKPEKVQKALLSEIHRILKTGGLLYLATENRFAANYLAFGRGHDGLFFSSILPRFLADLYSRLVKGHKYYMREFSYWRLKKTFQECRFSEVDFYCGVRSYNNPKRIMNLDNKAELLQMGKKCIKRKISRLGLSVLLASGLQKLFWPHFIVLCKK